MARLAFMGCEIAADEDGLNTAGTTVTRDTTNQRSGLGCWKGNTGAGSSPSTVQFFPGLNSVSHTIFYRAYWMFPAAPAADVPIMGQTNLIQVRLTTAMTFVLFDAGAGNAQIGAASSPVSTNSWHYVELSLTQNASSQTTAAAMRVDGVLVASGAPATPAGQTPTIGAVPLGTLTNFISYFDDISVNDETGAVNNSWPDAGQVFVLLPISDGARTGWTDGAGGTTALWQALDNTPPVGLATPAATSQIEITANNTTDTYSANLATYTSAGISAGSTLNAIKVVANHGYSNASVAVLGLQSTSNPAIGEQTFNSNGSNFGNYPINWLWGSILAEYGGTVGASVAVGTSPVVRVRHGTGSNTRTQSVDSLALMVDFGPAPPPLPEGFGKTRTLEQAVKRGAFFCLGEKWARKGRLWIPAADRPFAFA